MGIDKRIAPLAYSLFAGIAVLLWALDASLSSEASFDALRESLLFKLVVWAVVSALIYHSLAGIKHFIMDRGIGETMEGGHTGCAHRMGALSAVLIVAAGGLDMVTSSDDREPHRSLRLVHTTYKCSHSAGLRSCLCGLDAGQ